MHHSVKCYSSPSVLGSRNNIFTLILLMFLKTVTAGPFLPGVSFFSGDYLTINLCHNNISNCVFLST